VEAGEKPENTAIREVFEETGVKGKIVAPIGDIRYWYVREGEKIRKRVLFYLMEYLEGEPRLWKYFILVRILYFPSRYLFIKMEDLVRASFAARSSAKVLLSSLKSKPLPTPGYITIHMGTPLALR